MSWSLHYLLMMNHNVRPNSIEITTIRSTSTSCKHTHVCRSFPQWSCARNQKQTQRDVMGLQKYIKALSEKLEPFTVQLGDEVVIGGSVGDSRRVREVAPSEGVLRLRYEIGYIARRLSVVYDARAMRGLDTMAYVQHGTTDAILPGVHEMEIAAISVITTPL